MQLIQTKGRCRGMVESVAEKAVPNLGRFGGAISPTACMAGLPRRGLVWMVRSHPIASRLGGNLPIRCAGATA